MDEVRRKVRDLKRSVLSHIYGSTSTQLLNLLDQFDNTVAELTEVQEANESIDAELDCTKNENDRRNDRLEYDDEDNESREELGGSESLEGVSDVHVVNAQDEGDEDYGSLESLSVDSLAGFPVARNGRPVKGVKSAKDQRMACFLCQIEQTSGVSELKCLSGTSQYNATESFSNWKDFSQHVKDTHCTLDDALVKKNSLSVRDGKLLLNNGQPAKSLRVITKYSLMKCPLCSTHISLGPSYKNGYLKLCYHLYKKHKQTLPSHVQLHLCLFCDYTSHCPMLLQRHVEYNHSDVKNKYNQKVTCPVCQKSVLQRFLTRHMAVIHHVSSDIKIVKKAKVKCDICHKEFESKTNLERHQQRIHSKVNQYLCDLCSKSFYDNRDLIHHMYMKHESNPQDKPVLYCQVAGCEFSALTNDRVKKHFTICHSKTKSFVCVHCGKSFKAQHNLRQHETIMHPTGTDNYQCSQCNFSSHAEQYLKRHMKIHMETKSHKCTFPGCNYKSHFSENVKKHSRIHTPHHKLRLQAKREHNYMKSANKSVKKAAAASFMCPTSEQSTIQLLAVNRANHMESSAEQYMPYPAADSPIHIHTAAYSTAILPAEVKQETFTNKQAGDAVLMGHKSAETTQNIMAMHAMSDGHQLYQCQQQLDDLTDSNSYISL